jgi:hypothetical protein
MEITLVVWCDGAGHLRGTIRGTDRHQEREFSGAMDLMACIEAALSTSPDNCPSSHKEHIP